MKKGDLDQQIREIWANTTSKISKILTFLSNLVELEDSSVHYELGGNGLGIKIVLRQISIPIPRTPLILNPRS